MIHDLTLTYMDFTFSIPVLHITITTQIIYNVDDTFLLEFMSDSHHHLRFFIILVTSSFMPCMVLSKKDPNKNGESQL